MEVESVSVTSCESSTEEIVQRTGDMEIQNEDMPDRDNDSVASLEEDELLRSPTNSDNSKGSSDAWPMWTDDQKKVLNDYLNYTLEKLQRIQNDIEQINAAWIGGPIEKPKRKRKGLKKPESDLNSIIFK